MIIQKQQRQNNLILFALALLLALGIGYRFNTEMDRFEEANSPLETFLIK